VLFSALTPAVGIKEAPLTITALDTHEVVKELRPVGSTDEQAEAVTRVIRRSQDIDLSNLVTKTDYQLGLAATKTDLQMGLASTTADLQAGIAEATTELRTGAADLQIKLAETRSEILQWMVSTIGVQTIVILGAVVAVARVVPR
jgi:hypothetical protein